VRTAPDYLITDSADLENRPPLTSALANPPRDPALAVAQWNDELETDAAEAYDAGQHAFLEVDAGGGFVRHGVLAVGVTAGVGYCGKHATAPRSTT
jgi:hypothetical protein